MLATSGRRIEITNLPDDLQELARHSMSLQPLRLSLLLRAAWLCLRRLPEISDLLWRVLFQGREPILRRIRTLAHTWLGAYYAVAIQKSDVVHIHAHHGYFASWVAMVAARLLGISFSLTLHGSDLLEHAAYLDVKLANCSFCFTISEYNRQYLLRSYSEIPAGKVLLQCLGVDVPASCITSERALASRGYMLLLAVGRLHSVKNHAFLVQACARLKQRGIRFLCLIAGEGPERKSLEYLIAQLSLNDEVKLLGHLARAQLELYYAMADLVVLTSRSEGIPLVLMEAMAREKLVLAPAITGIPELVIDGETGFLFQSGSLEDFLRCVEFLSAMDDGLARIRCAARERVQAHFNRSTNLKIFGDVFLAELQRKPEYRCHENPVLQQI